MNTLAPLDKLNEKYKNKNFVILSISDRDSKKLVTAFKKIQRIKNQMYPNGGDVAELKALFEVDPHQSSHWARQVTHILCHLSGLLSVILRRNPVSLFEPARFAPELTNARNL
jgi:hypothetical protein